MCASYNTGAVFAVDSSVSFGAQTNFTSNTAAHGGTSVGVKCTRLYYISGNEGNAKHRFTREKISLESREPQRALIQTFETKAF